MLENNFPSDANFPHVCSSTLTYLRVCDHTKLNAKSSFKIPAQTGTNSKLLWIIVSFILDLLLQLLESDGNIFIRES